MAQKRLSEAKILDLRNEALLLKTQLNYSKKSKNVNKLLCNEGYRELLDSKVKSMEQFAKEWIDEAYERNMNHPEMLTITTPTGHMVRSKSEALIATLLYSNRIPYRYEGKLLLEGREFYPDFTILNPKTNKIVYWEHFGMMSNLDYARNSSDKIYLYSKNGIIPFDNLILTYESEQSSFDVMWAQNIIDYYF